jgi:YidC/Oxa1 family membrane protein insertase
MGYLYHELLYRPLLNALVLLYNTVAFRDLGIAIILLTILIRIVLLPIFQKGMEHQTKLQALQPKIKEVQRRHKHDKEKEMQATLALFKEHGTNPLSGVFFVLIQLPILIALYQIVFKSLSGGYENDLYSFAAPPGNVGSRFLDLINLRETSIVMVLAVACAQFAQSRIALATGGTESRAGARWATLVAGPAAVALVFFFLKLPNAVGLYWLVSTMFSIVQQRAVNAAIRRAAWKAGGKLE